MEKQSNKKEKKKIRGGERILKRISKHLIYLRYKKISALLGVRANGIYLQKKTNKQVNKQII